MYHYGHQVLPTMAVGTCLLYGYKAYQRKQDSKRDSWAVFALAAVTTISMLPFTWIFMVPTNSELFRLEAVSSGEPSIMGIDGAKELVVRWSWLHLMRSAFPLAGAVLGTLGTYGQRSLGN